MKKIIWIIFAIVFALPNFAQDNIVSIWLNDTVILYTQPFNHANEIYWGPPVDITYGGGADDLYNGMTNTNDIVAQLGDNGGVPYAALVCDTLTVGGFTDWYLPALWELIPMRTKVDSIGGWDTWNSDNCSYMWTSTSTSETEAICLAGPFETTGYHKSELANVRCIRREYHTGVSTAKNNEHPKIKYQSVSRKILVTYNGNTACHVEIVDINGRQVFYENLPQGNTRCSKIIDISGLRMGLYIVKVQSGVFTQTQKIVIY
jgi:hypothetical protein